MGTRGPVGTVPSNLLESINMTSITKAVRDLVVGDMVDLAGDHYADPKRDQPALECEYQIVSWLEVETPACICVFFEGFVCGFPPEHLVKLAGRESAGPSSS